MKHKRVFLFIAEAFLFCFFIIGLYFYYLGWQHQVRGADIIAMHIPYYTLLKNLGPFALWNPYSHCGAPALANIAYVMVYPLTFLVHLLEPVRMVHVFIFIHLLIFSFGVRIWLSCFLNSKALIYLGVLLALSNFSIQGLLEYGHLTILTNFSWMPWFLYFLYQFSSTSERDRKESSPWPWASLIFIYCSSLLGGHPQLNHLLAAFGGAYILLHHYLYKKLFLIRTLSKYALAMLFCFGIAFIQLYTTFDAIPFSGRSGSMSHNTFQSDGLLSPSILAKFFFPYLWGSPGRYWGQYDFWFGQHWAGIISIIGLACPFLFFKEKKWRPLIIITFLALLLGMGTYTPLHQFYQSLVPGANMFRLPWRFLYLFSILCLPFILETFNRYHKHKIFQCFIALTTLIYFFTTTAYQQQFQTFIQLLQQVLPLHVSDRLNHIGLSSSNLILKTSLSEISILILIVCYLYIQHKKFKLFLLILLVIPLTYIKSLLLSVPQDESFFQFSSQNDAFDRVEMMDSHSLHNLHLSYGLSSAGGYDSLSLLRYRQLLDTLLPQDWKKHTREQLYDIHQPSLKYLGIKYIAKNPEELQKGQEVWTQRPTLGRFYLTTDYTWPGRESSPFTDEILQQQELLKNKHLLEGWKFSPLQKKPLGNIKIHSYEHEEIVLSVELEQSAILASSENHFPNWKVKVNGIEKEIDLWLGTFRSIPLPKGKHQVVFSYSNQDFYFALYTSFSFLFIYIAYIIYCLLIRKKISRLI